MACKKRGHFVVCPCHMCLTSRPTWQVFKRLTTNSKFASLGVRVNLKDGSKSPTKKTATSPFKRHHLGHRVTLLSSPPV